MTTVSVGVIEGTGRFYAAPFLVALGRGYFEAEGLDVTAVEVVGTDGIRKVADDELDAGCFLSGLYFFQAWNPARPMVMVADAGHLRPGRGSGGISARKALLDSGELRDFSDLRGKRLALSPTQGNYDWLVFNDALRKGGLTYNDVEVVICGHGPAQHEALANGTVDVGTIGRLASIKEGRDAGIFDIWKEYGEVSPGRQMWCVMFSHAFSTRRPDEAYRLMKGYLGGVRDYFGAYEEGRDRAGVIKTLTASTGYSAAEIEEMTPLGLDPDGTLNVTSLAADLEWMQEAKVLPQPIPLDAVIDREFLNKALAARGSYASLKA